MSEWKKVKLVELYEVHNGLSKGRQFFGTGFPFLTFSNVFNNWFLPKQLESLVQTTDKEREACSIKAGDVFITRTSETMDELGMSSVALKDYPNATYNGFTKRLRPITDRVNPRYIGYYLRTPKFRGQFMAFSTMTTRASLANNDLLNMEVELPTMEIQHRIATILSRYDSLIENYQKQIKLLEEAAQRLYKEWFVDLRFPGHENTKIVDGVPEGWEKKKVGEVCDINKTNIPKEYKYDYIRYTDLGNVREGTIQESVRYDYGQEPGRAKRIAKDGDTIWGMVRPNLKSFALVQNPQPYDVYSTGFAVLSPVAVPFTFLYCALTTDAFVGYLVNCTNGAAYPAVKAEHFKNAEIIIPHEKLLESFHHISKPIFRKIKSLSAQIRLLSEARDRLLPKLMNGEISAIGEMA